MLVFNYAVKYCGKYYPANTPIAETAQKPAETAQDAFAEKGKEEPSPKPETAQKPAETARRVMRDEC